MRRTTTALVLIFTPSIALAAPDLAVHVEGAAAHPVGSEKSAQFSWGGEGTVAPELILNKVVGIEVEVGAVALSDGSGKPPPGVAPTGWGFAAFSTLGPRVRPLAPFDRGTGPFEPEGLWLAGGAGAGVTSGQVRPTISASVGYDINALPVAAGPFVGFFQMIETSNSVRPDDARVLMFGVHSSLSTEKRRALPKPPQPKPPSQEAPPPAVAPPPAPPAADPCATPDGAASNDPKCPKPAEEIQVVGDDLVLDDRIHFETGVAVVSASSYPLLQDLAAFLGEHPEYAVIHVEGHTDDTGPLPFNDRLSRARADAVRNLLIGFGVAHERLTIDAFGPRKPFAEGVSADARRLNRRVEFEILERTPVRTPEPEEGGL